MARCKTTTPFCFVAMLRLKTLLMLVHLAVVAQTAPGELCNTDGTICETISDSLNYDTLMAISVWWNEMALKEPFECQGNPVYSEEFHREGRNPSDLSFRSFKCEEATILQESRPFSFKGKIEDSKFEGPGKFKQGVVDDDDEDEANTGNVCVSTKNIGGVNISSIVGNFQNGVIHGNAKIEMTDGSLFIGQFVEGYRHGFFRYWNGNGELEELGYFYNENIVGRFWQRVPEEEHVRLVMVAPRSDKNQSMTQNVIERLEVVQFMSNFSYAIAGTNIQAILQHTRYVNINEVEISDCYLVPKWSRIPGKDFKFNSQTSEIRYYAQEEEPYPFCKQDDSWNSYDVSKSLLEWIRSLNSSNFDTIWQAEPLDEPVEPDAPRLIYDIQHVHGSNFTCKVLDSDDRFEFQSKFNPSTHVLDGAVYISFHNLSGMPRLPVVQARFRKMYGYMKDGFFEGTVLMELEDTRYLSVKVTRNVMHGFANVLGAVPVFPRGKEYTKKHYSVLSDDHGMAGQFRQGVPEGHFWLGTLGGGYLYGKVGEDGKFTGDEVGFIYPDLETVIYGKFEDRRMIDGRAAKVIQEKCNKYGIKVLKFSEPEGPSLFFSPPTNTSYGEGPRSSDPYEEQYVKVDQSGVSGGGEGVFAKVDIAKDQLAAVYSGILFRNEEERIIYNDRYTYNESLSIDERRAALKYSIGVGGDIARIDIPIDYDKPGSWMPSKAQKINCDLKDRGANVIFAHLDHPRYGLIVGAFAIRDIKAGEELFADYNYKKGNFPHDFPWYHEMKAKWEREKDGIGHNEEKYEEPEKSFRAELAEALQDLKNSIFPKLFQIPDRYREMELVSVQSHASKESQNSGKERQILEEEWAKFVNELHHSLEKLGAL